MEHDLFFEPSIIIERKIQRELSHTCCRIGEERLASEISYPRSQEHDSLSLPHFLSASIGPRHLVKSRDHSVLMIIFAFLSSSLENCQNSLSASMIHSVSTKKIAAFPSLLPLVSLSFKEDTLEFEQKVVYFIVAYGHRMLILDSLMDIQKMGKP